MLRHNLVVRLFLVLCAVAFVGIPAQARFLQTDPVGYKDDVNWYAYVQNDPTNKTDPTGQQSAGGITLAVAGNTCGDAACRQGALDQSAKAALPAAVVGVGLFGGLAVAEGLGEIATVTASAAGQGPVLAGAPAAKTDFIVTSEGVALRPTAAGNRASLEGAGLPGKPTTQTSETGTIHTAPGKDGSVDIRVMDGGSGGPSRVVTSRAGTNDPVKPSGERFPNGTPKQVRRDGSHVDLP